MSKYKNVTDGETFSFNRPNTLAILILYGFVFLMQKYLFLFIAKEMSLLLLHNFILLLLQKSVSLQIKID